MISSHLGISALKHSHQSLWTILEQNRQHFSNIQLKNRGKTSKTVDPFNHLLIKSIVYSEKN